jgi:SpoVK/Ycf46/Vps4 family AAA+-type ATPase
LPLKNNEIFEKLNINPPKGILLTGPTGSGKTAVGLAICKDIYLKFGHPIFYKPSTEFISGVSGDSEKNLRNLFKEAS